MPGPTTESLAVDFRDLLREMAADRSEFASFREEFAGFRGRVETQLSFLRWLGAFTAAILVTLVGSAIWLSWHASAMNQRMGVLEKTTSTVIQHIDALEKTTSSLNQRMETVEKTMSRLVDRLDPAIGRDKSRGANP